MTKEVWAKPLPRPANKLEASQTLQSFSNNLENHSLFSALHEVRDLTIAKRTVISAMSNFGPNQSAVLKHISRESSIRLLFTIRRGFFRYILTKKHTSPGWNVQGVKSEHIFRLSNSPELGNKAGIGNDVTCFNTLSAETC